LGESQSLQRVQDCYCAPARNGMLWRVDSLDPPSKNAERRTTRVSGSGKENRVAARPVKPSRTPAMRETTHRWLVNQRQPERSEVRPVARGQRTAKSGGRPRADGRDAEPKLRTCLNLVRRPVAQPSAEAGREASLEIRRARAAGRPCYEAERTPLAVENSVGEPAAIRRLMPALGKRAWRTPIPQMNGPP
jgi:hypothetical protein